jgi:hypothetical protein
MEYIQMKPNNIDVYVNEFHTCIKSEFEKSINKMYNEEINVYRDFIETIVKLPFIQVIIEENKTLKAKLQLLEDNNNNSNSVKLEIIDKHVPKTVLDIENIPFDTTNDDEDDSSTDDEDDADDSSSDEDDDNNCVADIQIEEKNGDMEEQPIKKAHPIKLKEPSADEVEEEQTADEEEEEPSADVEEEEPSADVEEEEEEEDFGIDNEGVEPLIKEDESRLYLFKRLEKEVDESGEEEEEEEPSADQEENKSPTFPIIKVNKLEGNNNLEEVNIKKVAEEEIETETEEEPSEDDEEEPSEDDEEEPSADPVEEPSVDQEEPSVDQEEPSVDQEEPSVDQEESEVIEIEIDGVTYYCDDEENGNIYEDDNGEVGNIVGEIKDGEALFFE